MVSEGRFMRLLEKAPNDVWALIELLRDGLDWPFPEMEPNTLQAEDILIDWRPEELHLDPAKVAKVADIFQVPKFTQAQECGVFVLNFNGGRLPVGAVRRLVDRLVANRRGRTGAGRLPQWSDVNDLIFFCLGSGPQKVVHVVSFREENGNKHLRTLSWSAQSSATQLDLIAKRDIGSLRWSSDKGPAIVGTEVGAPGFGSYRATIRGAQALAVHMAAIAQRLRDELIETYEVELDEGPIRAMYDEFQRELIGDLTPEKFADVFAQTMVYGLLSARIAHPEKFDASATLQVDFDNPLLDALYGKFSDDVTTGIDLSALGLQELAVDLASPELDVEKMLADFGAGNRREDPVVHFYEEFLNQYDHAQRIDAGAFYTPTPVVHFMVEAVDHLLREGFGLELGIADGATWGEVAQANGFDVPRTISPKQRFVSMVDPATGTGTYLVEWIRRAKKSFLSNNPASEWSDHFKTVVMPSMHAFEIMLAPYAVAHLKVALEANESAGIDPEISILLTDSLEQPGQELIFGPTDDPVAAEGERAAELKLHERFTVCIGNPPYDREQREQGDTGHRKGGVVRFGTEGIDPLLGDVLQVMRDNRLGQHAKNLYNDYVYFWRWAMWRTTDRPTGPGVAAFISPSSYLDGISLAGLRSVMRTSFDEFYIIDLGGDSLGTHVEQNVFDIRIPVTIGIGVRNGRQRQIGHPCQVKYVRVGGTRDQKLDWLSSHAFGDVDFIDVPGANIDVMTPVSDAGYWTWPDLEQLLPWSHSGSQLKRKWPIAPDVGSLKARWSALTRSTGNDQETAFRATEARRPSIGGRDLVTGKPTPALTETGGRRLIEPVRYGYRSFDREWVIPDSRVSDRPRPELWAARSDKQIFVGTLTSTKLGKGPALVATPYVPDLDFFRGSYGAKNIVPLWRDAKATTPNVSRQVREALETTLGKLKPDDLLAYIYGLAGTAAFTSTFIEPLTEQKGHIHVPITKDRGLFDEVAGFGRELLHWHTFGERYGAKKLAGQAAVKKPIAGRPDSFVYDVSTRELRIGTGAVSGVSPEVWAFEVSGLKVLQSWLDNRSALGSGRTSSPLDAVRYDEWEFTDELLLVLAILQHTVDVTPTAQALLDKVLAGDIFLASELPQPTAAEKSAPR
jgi:hypothetical protein